MGQVAEAIAGRDINRKFIITCIIDEQYVYISDGNLRKVENPKKKKAKHLKGLKHVAEDIRLKLLSNHNVTNNEIRKYLKSLEIYREQEV